ncbi:MAG: hypothetical protein Q4C47_05560 [Planctomycetia bacterium]|nr:hypothetical protein [Planctomycetia bacterium]
MNIFRFRFLSILVGVAITCGISGVSYGQAWLIGGFDAAIPVMPGPADYVYSPGYQGGSWVYSGGPGYYGGRYGVPIYSGNTGYDGWMNRGWRFHRGYYRSGCGCCGVRKALCVPRRVRYCGCTRCGSVYW